MAQEDEKREKGVSRNLHLSDILDAVADAVVKHPFVAGAVMLFVIALVLLYGPVRDYYISCRNQQYYRAEYSAVVANNDALTEDVQHYVSEEGIKDEAHRHGYVEKGETSVVVEGAPEREEIPALDDIEVKTDRPFYIKVLDLVFFYKEGVTQ